MESSAKLEPWSDARRCALHTWVERPRWRDPGRLQGIPWAASWPGQKQRECFSLKLAFVAALVAAAVTP